MSRLGRSGYLRPVRLTIEGWLNVDGEYTTLYPTKQEAERATAYDLAPRLWERLQHYNGKHVRIVIEVVEE